MSSRFWPIYLIAAAVGTAASAGAGAALGNYAAGSIDPFYSKPRFAAVEPLSEPAERAPEFIAAAADLDSQWPVGSMRDE